MKYYCIQCEKVHVGNYSINEFVYVTGFHYVDSILHSAGICNTLQDQKDYLKVDHKEIA